MTVMCRFDFNSGWIAIFHRSGAVLLGPMATGALIAVRDKSFAKSRRRKLFWM